MACSKSSKEPEDFFGNVPDIVIDKILEELPIRMAARTSVLSNQWRCAWLSQSSLFFGFHFWKEQLMKDSRIPDFSRQSRIISNILLHHKGPVQDFYLYLPPAASREHLNHSPWISFLSGKGVKQITIRNYNARIPITSYIFCCSELVCLQLKCFCLSHLPTNFSGFPKLKRLVLEDFEFIKQNIFSILIKNCRMLETLQLVECIGVDHIVIDAPSLQTLILIGNFESLSFRNLRSLKSISMRLATMPKKLVTVGTIDAVYLLANSNQLQYINFEGHLCKFIGAGGDTRSSSVTFNHLHELCLSGLVLSDFGTYRFLLSMIKCCPYIKVLVISVTYVVNVGEPDVDFNYNYKLDHLREIYINGSTGLRAELKLVKYLLAISVVLENLFFVAGIIGIESKLKMFKALLRFPRASPKARVLIVEN